MDVSAYANGEPRSGVHRLMRRLNKLTNDI